MKRKFDVYGLTAIIAIVFVFTILALLFITLSFIQINQ